MTFEQLVGDMSERVGASFQMDQRIDFVFAGNLVQLPVHSFAMVCSCERQEGTSCSVMDLVSDEGIAMALVEYCHWATSASTDSKVD